VPRADAYARVEGGKLEEWALQRWLEEGLLEDEDRELFDLEVNRK
jgi:hypothetical protein